MILAKVVGVRRYNFKLMAQRVNIEQLSPQELYQIKQGF